MNKICANHDVIVRAGETDCPTCKEIKYPKEEIDLLKDRAVDAAGLIILLHARLTATKGHTELTTQKVVDYYDTMTDSP